MPAFPRVQHGTVYIKLAVEYKQTTESTVDVKLGVKRQTAEGQEGATLGWSGWGLSRRVAPFD